MGWKDWSYLVRGLLLGFVIGLIWLLLSVVVDGFKSSSVKMYFGFLLVSILIFCFTYIVAGLL